jgi:membrane associated rhomboid family serine protease
MRYDEPLVGSLAIVIAVVAAAIAVGPWTEPYRLRTFSAISQRYGKPVARGVWIAIAIASLTSGFAILAGVRPGYADPAHRADHLR